MMNSSKCPKFTPPVVKSNLFSTQHEAHNVPVSHLRLFV
jgi:hypothetical protein